MIRAPTIEPPANTFSARGPASSAVRLTMEVPGFSTPRTGHRSWSMVCAVAGMIVHASLRFGGP